jgi:hypothetical protein
MFYHNYDNYLFEKHDSVKNHTDSLIFILGKEDNLRSCKIAINNINRNFFNYHNGELSSLPLEKWLSNFNENGRDIIINWFKNHVETHDKLINLFHNIEGIPEFIDFYNNTMTGKEGRPKFYSLELPGVGKGKLLMSWCIPNSIVNSDGKYFDLEINGRKIEVKDLTTRVTPLEEIKLNLIAKTRVSHYNFWIEMGKTIYNLKTVEDKILELESKIDLFENDENKIIVEQFLLASKDILDPKFLEDFESTNFENMENWQKIVTFWLTSNNFLKVYKAEIGEDTYDLVRLISSKKTNKPILLHIDPIEISTDIPDSIELHIKETNDAEKLIDNIKIELLKFRYVRTPSEFLDDILWAEDSIRNMTRKINILLFTKTGVRIISGSGRNNLIFNCVGSNKVKISFSVDEPASDLSTYKFGLLSQNFMKKLKQ